MWRRAPCLEISRCAATSPSEAWPWVFRNARIVSRLDSTKWILRVSQHRHLNIPGETSIKESRLDPGFAGLAAHQLHPVGASSCNFGDGLLQDSALEVEAREFVHCVAGWKAGGDQLLVDGPPALFAVVVRACAAGQEPETIPQRRQRRSIVVDHR